MAAAPIVVPFAMRRLPDPPIRRGRPTDLTDDKAHKILIALANGSYRGPAAEFAGVPEETLSRWLARKGQPYETFQAWVREAEAHAEIRMVNAITSAATAKPEYAVAFLERKFPERWGRTVAQPPVDVNVNIMGVLQQIEARANIARDPRPPRDGQHTVLDMIKSARAVPLNGDQDGDDDAAPEE